MREERRLRVFEIRVLRRIFRPKRDEVTGEYEKLHNEEISGYILLTKYFSVDQIEMNEMDGECSAYGREERCI